MANSMCRLRLDGVEKKRRGRWRGEKKMAGGEKLLRNHSSEITDFDRAKTFVESLH